MQDLFKRSLIYICIYEIHFFPREIERLLVFFSDRPIIRHHNVCFPKLFNGYVMSSAIPSYSSLISEKMVTIMASNANFGNGNAYKRFLKLCRRTQYTRVNSKKVQKEMCCFSTERDR